MAHDTEMQLLIELMDRMVIDRNTTDPAEAVRRIGLLGRIIMLRQKALTAAADYRPIFNPDEGSM